MSQSTESRPPTLTSEQIKAGTTKSEGESWRQKGELWRWKTLDRIIDEFSGMGGNTDELFQKNHALLYAQRDAGLECDEEIIANLEYARVSGDIGGKNKIQMVQMVEEKAAVFPGAGGLYPEKEEEVGFWRGLFNRFTGVKET
jgi:hypothetical protein